MLSLNNGTLNQITMSSGTRVDLCLIWLRVHAQNNMRAAGLAESHMPGPQLPSYHINFFLSHFTIIHSISPHLHLLDLLEFPNNKSTDNWSLRSFAIINFCFQSRPSTLPICTSAGQLVSLLVIPSPPRLLSSKFSWSLG